MRIFVSYAREDSKEVERYVSRLESDPDIDVFWDINIPIGKHFLDILAEQSARADTLIVFLSRSAFNSKYVKPEVFMAHEAGIEIVPVYLEPVPEGYGAGGLKLILSDREAISAYESDFETSNKKLVETIRKNVKFVKSCPIIAVMGAKGGVGKSSIIKAMAELIAMTGQNTLIIDADTETAGITKYSKTYLYRVWTTLDACFAKQHGGDKGRLADKGVWEITPSYLQDNHFGKIYLIPGRLEGDTRIGYDALANIQPETKRNEVALEVLREQIDRSVQQGLDLGAVLIDCGAMADPLVSAGIAMADYPFIVAGPNVGFSEEIPHYERMHKQRYPEKYNRIMQVIVNQATEHTPRSWAGVRSTHFVREDIRFRQSAAEGTVDFTGVGLNNFYHDVLQVMLRCFQPRDQRLLPEPVKVWVAPYIRAMKDFPERMLARAKYHFLTLTTFGFILVALLLLAGALLGAWVQNTAVEVRIDKPEAVTDSDFRTQLEKTVIPENLRNRMFISVSTSIGAETSPVSGRLVLRGPIYQKNMAQIHGVSSYPPLVSAIHAGVSKLREKMLVFLVWVIMGVAICIMLIAAGCVRHRNLSKQKRFLLMLIRARDDRDDKQLAHVFERILAKDAGGRQLRWLKNEYKAHLVAWELGRMIQG